MDFTNRLEIKAVFFSEYMEAKTIDFTCNQTDSRKNNEKKRTFFEAKLESWLSKEYRIENYHLNFIRDNL